MGENQDNAVRSSFSNGLPPDRRSSVSPYNGDLAFSPLFYLNDPAGSLLKSDSTADRKSVV